MARKVLIPLDGSKLSDRVVAKARRLLRRERRLEFVLLRVLQPQRGLYEERGARTDLVADQGSFKLRRDACRHHLHQLEQKFGDKHLRLSSQILIGDPTERILLKIAQLQPSLVAMATHGRSGPSRWLRGSVAERVLRRSPAPLLMWTPTSISNATDGARRRHILVPTDGSAWAASVLPILEDQIDPRRTKITLLRVARDRSGGEEAVRAVYEADLEPDRMRLFSAGFQARTRIEFGEPAATILDVARSANVDLIAMATHGRTGLGRWLFGSVADRVVQCCGHPLLLIRVAAGQEARPLRSVGG